MPLKYNRNLIPRSRELRKNATAQENKLWYDFLSQHPLRFRRQKIIKGFIADFYCATAMLVIELDGKQHTSKQGLAYDTERDGIIKELGVMVLRITNDEINHGFDAACRKIDETITRRMRELPERTHNPKPPLSGEVDAGTIPKG